jgi:hypothetical protein
MHEHVLLVAMIDEGSVFGMARVSYGRFKNVSNRVFQNGSGHGSFQGAIPWEPHSLIG